MMPTRKILEEGRDYTFRSYFELTYEPDEILAEFDYTLIIYNAAPKITEIIGDRNINQGAIASPQR